MRGVTTDAADCWKKRRYIASTLDPGRPWTTGQRSKRQHRDTDSLRSESSSSLRILTSKIPSRNPSYGSYASRNRSPPPPSKLFVCSKTIDYVVLCRCVCLRSRETSKRPFGSFRSIAPNAKNSDEHMCWRFKLHGLLASAICFVESVFQSIKSIKKERNVHVMKYKLLFELQIMIIMLGCNMLNHNDCRASIGLLYDKCHQSRPSMQGRSRSTGTCFNMVTRLLTFSPAFYTCTLCYY